MTDDEKREIAGLIRAWRKAFDDLHNASPWNMSAEPREIESENKVLKWLQNHGEPLVYCDGVFYQANAFNSLEVDIIDPADAVDISRPITLTDEQQQAIAAKVEATFGDYLPQDDY